MRPAKQVSLHPGLGPVLAEVGEVPSGGFSPARFQWEALGALERGDVLVLAPTGSGKTWIAQEAIQKGLAPGRQIWYTTPLKALSNQKFRQFQGLFGEEAVGLVTGERRINPRAPLIVGTTEILRNILYGGGEEFSLIVLDEAHYLGDAERGTVWEEVLMLAPQHSRLLLLSASLPNVDELAGWLEEVRGRPPRVVREDERPVPLRTLLVDGRGALLPTTLAPKLRPEPRRQGWLVELVRQLEAGGLLPAILFFPSRRECDLAARELSVLRAEGAEERARALGRWESEYPTLLGHSYRHTLIQCGAAPHHAGHLMAWRLAVEEMLSRGLVRAVAATTTLASGLDVPARTVVLSTLVRNSPQGPVELSATEFQQMSGRAGRRGRDRVGIVVVPASDRGEARLGLAMARSDAEPVTSAFTPSYSQVLNMLSRRSLRDALDGLGRSFAAYQGHLGRRPKFPREMPAGAVAREASLADDGLSGSFLLHAAVLQKLGYLDAEARLTGDGRWAARLRHRSNLILAEIVRRGQIPQNGPRLAAIAAALGTERPPREGGRRARLTWLSHLVSEISRLELSFGIEPDPVAGEFRTEWQRTRRRILPSPAERRAEAVETWARGVEWTRLIAQAGAEEGDLQRAILQAAEILMQLEGLQIPALRALARATRETLLRPPIT